MEEKDFLDKTKVYDAAPRADAAPSHSHQMGLGEQGLRWSASVAR